jgi:glucose/mannose-6-phosphate isomerase
MLDDAAYVHNLDHSNALGVIAGQPNQLKQSFDFQLKKGTEVRNIVLAGMGGSALGTEFLRSWLADKLPVPVVVVRDYNIPGFINEHTLLFASSYSGNTEESLSALAQAEKTGAQIFVMSAGGRLKEQAEAGGHVYVQVPGGYQPRLAILYSARVIAQALIQLGILDELVIGEMEAAADWVTTQLGAWTLDSPTDKNLAKQIAESVVGHPVVIYGGPTLAMCAMKWKIDLNENAKNAAFYYSLPEFSHNEFNGWLFPNEKNLKVIELQSSLDHPQINKRFEISNRLLSGKLPKPIIVNAKGETKVQQMLWTLILGDFVSAYVAFLNGIDPTPVDLIEKLKKELEA